MLGNQNYSEYLSKKSKNTKQNEERLRFLTMLDDTITRSGAAELTDATEKDIGDFLQSLGWSAVEKGKAFEFLADYESFIRKGQLQLKHVADVIFGYSIKEFEDAGKKAAVSRKKTIVPIPDDAKIDVRHLDGVENSEFIAAFRELQIVVADVYDDIEKAPFEWGYPDFYTTDGYYNILIDFLFGFITAGDCKDGTLMVNAKKFRALTSVKRHKKHEKVIAGLQKMGFDVKGFDKKSTFFEVAYLKNQHVITALNSYVSGLDGRSASWSMALPRYSLSHRFIEDITEQEHETVFHATMDLSTEKLKEIQYWMHAEAEKYGFKIDDTRPLDKHAICYQKGSKTFLLVGEMEINGVPTIFSKVIFRDVFESEKEKIAALNGKFSDTFKSNCWACNGKDSKCVMRICYDIDDELRRNCAYRSFYFYNLTLDDVKALVELHIAENKIK